MTEADIIIKADYVLKMDKDLTVLEDGAIAVKDGRIAAVGKSEELLSKFSSKKIAGGNGYVAFPGFVNTHTHSPMVYFRGLSDDIPLKNWLEDYIWPAENKWLSENFVADAAELACAEMVKAGITLFNDMYFFGDTIARTAKRMGLRALIGAGVLDFPSKTANTAEEYLDNAATLIKKWKGDEFISPCIAPHSAYACGPATLKEVKKISEELGIRVSIHLSETPWEVGEILSRYGKRPVEHLDSIGFLDESVIAAHCIWIEEGEIEILAKRKVNISLCIESNLKLASGFAPVPAMLAKGIKVTFGTDGAASNNDLNILSEVSTAAKVYKALANDPTVLDAKSVLLMATRWAAEALGFGNSCGSLEEGKSADIVVANLNKPHLLPLYDIYSQIVYSMTSADISSVIVNGRVLMDERKLTLADESEILGRAQQWGAKIKRDLKPRR